jgi:hypothetical protein
MEEQLLQQSDWVAPEARHDAACDEHVGIRWPAVASVFGVASHIGRGPGGGVGGSDDMFCVARHGSAFHLSMAISTRAPLDPEKSSSHGRI